MKWTATLQQVESPPVMKCVPGISVAQAGQRSGNICHEMTVQAGKRGGLLARDGEFEFIVRRVLELVTVAWVMP